MGTLTDYVENSLAPFSERPFSAEDSLVLNQLVYLRMPPCVPRIKIATSSSSITPPVKTETVTREKTPTPAPLTDTDENPFTSSEPCPIPLHQLDRSEWLKKMTEGMTHDSDVRELLRAASESPRFRDIRIDHFVESSGPSDRNRFSACTFDLGDGTLYISFRGTDGTLAGWYEDFRLLFIVPPLPSQQEAMNYTHQVVRGWHGSIMLGGHSMGGNLAAYVGAAIEKPLQRRIRGVWAADSPGFIQQFIDTPGFHAISNRLHKVIPESSMIGMLFNSGVSETIVRSSARGVDQHFMTTWLFDDSNEHLVTTDHLSRYSQYLAGTINSWRQSVPVDERRAFIDTLFATLRSTGYNDFRSLAANWSTVLPQIRTYLSSVPPEQRKQLSAVMEQLRHVILGQSDSSDQAQDHSPSQPVSPSTSQNDSRAPKDQKKDKKKDAKTDDDQNTQNSVVNTMKDAGAKISELAHTYVPWATRSHRFHAPK